LCLVCNSVSIRSLIVVVTIRFPEQADGTTGQMTANSLALSAPGALTAAAANAADVTAGLIDWIAEAVAGSAPGVAVAVVGSDDVAAPSGVSVRLIGLEPRVVPTAPGRDSKVLALDYLITFNLDDALAEHGLVTELAFAALARCDFELVGSVNAAAVCQSLGLAPAQGLVIRTELRRDAVLPVAPLVRHPPITQLEPLAQAEGLVVGPGGIPISNALVMLKGSNRSATTGPDGRFCFAIPAGTPAKVTARARMREVSASLNEGATTVLKLPMEA
jgi:Carboxypeptidase regulatory-like domain